MEVFAEVRTGVIEQLQKGPLIEVILAELKFKGAVFVVGSPIKIILIHKIA